MYVHVAQSTIRTAPSSKVCMDTPDALASYAGVVTVAFLLAYGLRCVFKLYAPTPETRSKQIRLTRSQVMEIACNLAKMSAHFPGNSQKCIDLVQKYDLDVNFFLPHVGLTIFLSSCIGGQAELVKTLLEHEGADISITSIGGDSPLYLAVAGYFHWPHRHFKIFCQLINAGCSVNDVNNGGYTPLHLAASQGDIHLIEFLLEKGANPFQQTLYHSLPVDMAIEAGHLKAAELLNTKHHPHRHKYFPKTSTPFHEATRPLIPLRTFHCQTCGAKQSKAVGRNLK